MRVTADTNLLLRLFLIDDAAQTSAAIDVLERAELVAVSLVALCEFAWVLTQRYQIARGDLVQAIEALIATRNVTVDRPGVEAGLAALQPGGDCADGVIQGRWLGADTFVSFDKRAVRVLKDQGQSAQLVG